MTKAFLALLTAFMMMSGAQRAAAADAVCSDHIEPGSAEQLGSFELQCSKDELVYATVQCAARAEPEPAACSYAVDDPGDCCAGTVSCNVYFLSDDDQILDHIYIEEGAANGDTGLWAKTRISCACDVWR